MAKSIAITTREVKKARMEKREATRKPMRCAKRAMRKAIKAIPGYQQRSMYIKLGNLPQAIGCKMRAFVKRRTASLLKFPLVPVIPLTTPGRS